MTTPNYQLTQQQAEIIVIRLVGLAEEEFKDREGKASYAYVSGRLSGVLRDLLTGATVPELDVMIEKAGFTQKQPI